EFVGEDEFGNRYYRTRGGKIDPTLGYERRWVIYNGTAEASIVPPSWHGWLHHTVDTPPTQEEVTPRPWWKPHRPNLTGTPAPHPPAAPPARHGRGHTPPDATTPRAPGAEGAPPTPHPPSPRRILGVNRQACPPVFEHRPMARLLRIACFVAAPVAAWATLGV